MEELTTRQTKILKVIIEEHIKTGQPVGSETLDKKYSLGISPATIRNEMVVLTNNGFCSQPHTSAGRIPTATALKFYIQKIMEEKKLSVTQEAAVKQKVWDYREKIDRFFHEATRALAEQTKALAVAAIDGGDIYHAGHANILDMPEFYDIDVTRTILSIIDDFVDMQAIFEKAIGEEAVHILLGEDLGNQFLSPCGLVFTQFNIPNRVSGCLGVLGPTRLDYCSVIPTVRYFGDLIREIGENW